MNHNTQGAAQACIWLSHIKQRHSGLSATGLRAIMVISRKAAKHSASDPLQARTRKRTSTQLVDTTMTRSLALSASGFMACETDANHCQRACFHCAIPSTQSIEEVSPRKTAP